MSEDRSATRGSPPRSPGDAPMDAGDDAPAGTPGTGENLCPVCSGRGSANGIRCTNCDGTGKVNVGIGGA